MFVFGFICGVAFVMLAAAFGVASEESKKKETTPKTIKRVEPVNPWDLSV